LTDVKQALDEIHNNLNTLSQSISKLSRIIDEHSDAYNRALNTLNRRVGRQRKKHEDINTKRSTLL